MPMHSGGGTFNLSWKCIQCIRDWGGNLPPHEYKVDFQGHNDARRQWSHSGWHLGRHGDDAFAYRGDTGVMALDINYRGEEVQWRVKLHLLNSTEPGCQRLSFSCLDERPVHMTLDRIHFRDGTVIDVRPKPIVERSQVRAFLTLNSEDQIGSQVD